jgi:hypothetical protein
MKHSRQFFFDTGPIIRYLKQFLMKATVRRKTNNKGIADQSNGSTSGEDGSQDASPAS